MKCSVFIATSADGYIATKGGEIDWLENAGEPNVDMGEQLDMGFNNYLASVDCMIIGRKTMEKISSFNLTLNQWPYGNLPIFVLSNTLKAPPSNFISKVEIYSGEIPLLISRLIVEGFQHAYIDGGMVITSFLNLGLINEMIITQAPIFLGEGRPLFGRLNKQIKLKDSLVKTFPNDFIQIQYKVDYPK